MNKALMKKLVTGALAHLQGTTVNSMTDAEPDTAVVIENNHNRNSNPQDTLVTCSQPVLSLGVLIGSLIRTANC